MNYSVYHPKEKRLEKGNFVQADLSNWV